MSSRLDINEQVADKSDIEVEGIVEFIYEYIHVPRKGPITYSLIF